ARGGARSRRALWSRLRRRRRCACSTRGASGSSSPRSAATGARWTRSARPSRAWRGSRSVVSRAGSASGTRASATSNGSRTTSTRPRSAGNGRDAGAKSLLDHLFAGRANGGVCHGGEEVVALERVELRSGGRADGRGARRVPEQRDLAEEVAAPCGPAGAVRDLELAVADDVEAVADIALAHDQRAGLDLQP